MPDNFERKLSGLAVGAIDPASMTPKDQAGLLKYCCAIVRRKQRRIRNCVTSEKTRIARKQQNEFLRCLPARLIAAQIAIRKVNRRNLVRPAGPYNTIPFTQVWQLTQRLTRYLSSPSFGVVRLKPKRNGEFREVCMFTDFDVARQTLVAMSITPFARLHPSQYALRGGRSAACGELLNALNLAPEGTKFMHVDVNNFYGSISHGWLREKLPVPANIVQQVISLNGMRNVLRWHLGLAHQHDEGTEGMDRQGIPQGSAVSPIVAEFVIADVLRNKANLFEGLSFFNYCDNLGILVPKDWDETAFTEQLRDVFQKHPAGPFHIRIVSADPINTEFRFLGYYWKKTPTGAKAYIPEQVAWERKMNFERDILECENKEQMLRIEHSFRSYYAAFPLWDGREKLLNNLLRISAGQRS